MPIIAFTALGLGVLLILLGCYLTVRKAPATLTQAGEGTGGLVASMAKLADALSKYPPGMVMIFLGVLLVCVSAVVGGVGSL